MFVDRDEETRLLNEALGPGKPALVRLWGRRRLGKTTLLRERVKDAIYLYVDESTGDTQVPRLLAEFKRQTGRDLDATDWSGLFRGLADPHRIIVFDEFQRLLEADKTGVAALQDAWDNHLSKNAQRMVLCGSSVGMMERLVKGKGAPLMGRFTSQIQLHPLRFPHVRLMHPNRGLEDCLEWYGVFGGTPFYQEQARGKDIMAAIRHAFLAPGAPLLEEPENLLASELRRPALYTSILTAVGAGNRKVGEIAAALNRKSTALTPYIQVLVRDLGILQKDDPVLGGSQNARYDFADPFFRFYYSFIHPHAGSIRDGLSSPVEEDLERRLPSYFGKTWEKVVRDALLSHANGTWRGLDLRVDRVGGWWTRRGEHEMDVVAASDSHVVLGSCKWSAARMDEGDLAKLEQAANVFPAGERRIALLLASKTGFSVGLSKRATDRPDIVLLTPADLNE